MLFDVSIHAFRGEGDGVHVTTITVDLVFQSTPSGGKATQRMASVGVAVWFQSTPSGGKATNIIVLSASSISVSIHAFRGEGDQAQSWGSCSVKVFQSTPSGGKATSHCLIPFIRLSVSIHAFRGEGDHIIAYVIHNCQCFNPRLPGGRRHDDKPYVV